MSRYALGEFASERPMFGRHHEGSGRATPILKILNYLENYYRRAVEYFCMIPFASSRHGPKLIFNFFPNMPDPQKGRDRATPIFR